MSPDTILEYLNCYCVNSMALMYCCTCSSSIYDMYDMIRELLFLSKACFRYCCFSSYMRAYKSKQIPEGQDRSCSWDPPLNCEGLQHDEAESFLFCQNSIPGANCLISLHCASPLFELFCRHLAHIPLLFKRAGLRMCVYDTHSPQAALQSQRADMKLSNQLQLHFVNNF